MIKLLLAFCFMCMATVTLQAQASDFITVKKKNGRTLKTYFPGLPITFSTIDNYWVQGQITAIKNDTVYINQLIIRSLPTIWGVNILDTAGSLLTPVHYRDIKQVVFDTRSNGFSYIKDGTLLMIAGGGYALLNVINGAYFKSPLSSADNKKRLGIALGTAGAGYILNRIQKNKHKHYQVEYVRMTTINKQLRRF